MTVQLTVLKEEQASETRCGVSGDGQETQGNGCLRHG